jgi:AcrR family transcriptional regulator
MDATRDRTTRASTTRERTAKPTVARTPAASRSAEPPRPARDRGATEARIVAAVGEVLARDGFGGTGINAIAKQAGVDKVLIYRYFGGLPELLRHWGKSGRFWPSVDELLGKRPAAFMALPVAERYAHFMEHFIDGLRARPLTLEILAAEVAQRTELTVILEAEREAWGGQAAKLLGGKEFADRPELRGLTILLISGVQYLLVRGRKIRVFGGIDIQSDAGWAELKAAVRKMALRMFDAE